MASNKRLNAVITIGGAVAGTLRTAIGSTTSGLGKIGTEIRRVKAEQKMLTDAIRTFGSMGKNVDNLRARYAASARELDKLVEKQKELNDLSEATAANDAAKAEAVAQIGESVAIVASMTAPIVAAANFETAMLGVAKQLQGARDDAGNLTAEYYGMEKQVKSLGREFPTAIGDIAKSVENGLRQNVAKKYVIDFTRTMLKMSDAMELPVEQLTEDMGKIGIMYKRSASNMMELADSINYLDDNAISTSGGIIEFLRRVGGTAAMVKITDRQVAALGSTLLTLGETEESASTAMNAVFSKLGAANTQSKPFREMLADIGFKTHQVGNMMQKDAVGGIMAVMDAIRKLPKISKNGEATQIDAVATLFGSEHWDTFSKLLENRKELQRQLDLAMTDGGKGSVNKEYEARMKTTNAQWGIFQNRLMEITINIGTVLLPVVNDVVAKIGDVVSKIADWSSANPQLTKAIIGTAFAVAGLRVAVLAAKVAFTFLNGYVLQARGALLKLRGVDVIGGIKAVGTVIRMVGMTLLRTPWGLAAAGLVTAGIAIYKYWDRIKAFFGGFFQGVVQGLQPVTSAFSNWVQSMGWLQPVLNKVGQAVGVVYDWFVKLLSPTKATDEQLKNATNAGQTFGRVVGAAINIVLTPVKMLVNALSWISSNIGSIIGKVGSLADSGLQKVGSAIDKAKSFIGLGDAPAQSPRSVPAVPPMRGGNTSTYAPQISNSFTINAAPGMNTDQLANDIMGKINKQNGIKQRSSMIDGAYAQ